MFPHGRCDPVSHGAGNTAVTSWSLFTCCPWSRYRSLHLEYCLLNSQECESRHFPWWGGDWIQQD